jgi:hypothetical protein
VEIHTGGLGAVRTKLERLLSEHRVTLVHPIAAETWIVKLPIDPEPAPSRRRSPKRGTPHDLFLSLVGIPRLIRHPNLTIELALTSEEQVRRFDGKRGRRRRGWIVVERRLLEIREVRRFATVDDFARLLPEDLPEIFDTADIAAALGRTRRLAQAMAYCLREMGCIEPVGRARSGIRYRRTV